MTRTPPRGACERRARPKLAAVERVSGDRSGPPTAAIYLPLTKGHCRDCAAEIEYHEERLCAACLSRRISCLAVEC